MALYDDFFGLRASPFGLNPDPRFLFLGRRHREALAGLVHAVQDGKGFAVLAGEVGTGKTTLVHALLTELGDGARSAVLFNPGLSRAELHRHLLNEFQLPAQGSVLDAMRCLQAFLLEQFGAGRRVVVILDEAHGLSPETLEEVRLLSNFETSKSKLLQVLLVGQPELMERLRSPGLRQLRQRIALRLELAPFDFGETVSYVRSRVAAAGGRSELFAPGAYEELYRLSAGIPRLINVLCDNALLTSFARDLAQVSAALMRLAGRDLDLQPVARLGLWERWRGPHRRAHEADDAAVAGDALRALEVLK
jgi:general secretion pathway protein A